MVLHAISVLGLPPDEGVWAVAHLGMAHLGSAVLVRRPSY